jgi:1-deoxy-D-xylulose-5-phosphate reductoisomerase
MYRILKADKDTYVTDRVVNNARRYDANVGNAGSLDLFKIAHLDFEAPDTGRFPCLRLAFEALRLGGTAPAILNAANEIAVAAFLARKLRFVDIPRLIEAILEHMPVVAVDSLAGVSEADDAARRLAREWLDRRA